MMDMRFHLCLLPLFVWFASQASSFSSVTDSTMSLNIITVTLNMGQWPSTAALLLDRQCFQMNLSPFVLSNSEKYNFLGISIVGQSNERGDGGIYIGSIMKGGAVAADGRIEPGDMLLQVRSKQPGWGVIPCRAERLLKSFAIKLEIFLFLFHRQAKSDMVCDKQYHIYKTIITFIRSVNINIKNKSSLIFFLTKLLIRLKQVFFNKPLLQLRKYRRCNGHFSHSCLLLDKNIYISWELQLSKTWSWHHANIILIVLRGESEKAAVHC